MQCVLTLCTRGGTTILHANDIHGVRIQSFVNNSHYKLLDKQLMSQHKTREISEPMHGTGSTIMHVTPVQ